MDPVEQFSSITGASRDVAQQHLEACKGDIDAAVAMFFDGGAASSSSSDPAPRSVAPATSRPPPTRGNIATFSDLGSGGDAEDPSGRNEYFAGGGEHSGIALDGGPKDATKSLFEAAQKNATQVDPSELPGAAPAQRFGGSGFKLGEAGEETTVQQPRIEDKPKQRVKVTFTMWKNGFTVDDGTHPVVLRDTKDPANQQFLNDIAQGHVPQELATLGYEIYLDMHDNHTEDYVAPRAAFRTFVGEGFKLGNPSTVKVVQSSATTATSGSSSAASGPATPFDESAPSVKLQIRLADGTKLVSKFNLSQTIGDIRAFINASKPGQPPQYQLSTSYPKKVLPGDANTLTDAGLTTSTALIQIIA